MYDYSFLFGRPTQKQKEMEEKILSNLKEKVEKSLREDKNAMPVSADIRKIAVVTSGAADSGMNAAIYSVVRTAQSNGVEVCGVHNGFRGIMEGDFVELNALNVCNLFSCGGTKLLTYHAFSLMHEETVAKMVETARRFGIDAVVAIGGEGSICAAGKLSSNGLPCVAVPSGIDASIPCTDYTIGFDSALNSVQLCVERLNDTALSHRRCFVVEVSGHCSGKLALAAGVAVGATAVLIPEKPYDITSDVIDRIRHARRFGKPNIIVLVADGVCCREGITTSDIAKEIEEQTGMECRATNLGFLQRGGSPTARDRVMASLMANHAVHLLLNGHSNRVVAVQEGCIKDFDIETALNMNKDIDEKLYKCITELLF